jgi:Na+/proline symporter
MHPIDWTVVAIYCIASLVLGVVLSKRASPGLESYFAGNRKITWWLAGTSMAATAFSSDTPLLVTGITRSRGLWGNWEIWALAVSTMLTVFFFSKLWKRTGVLTEVELTELRYAGKSASFLRGFKAVYWGLFYNAFIIGAWPITGLVKVMQETTDWSKSFSILFCLGLTAVYACLSGYWGVVLTDLFQFAWAMIGAVILAGYALQAVGGPSVLVEKLSATGKLSFLPPAEDMSWLLGLFLIQWWAWKNSDGGGIAVQRMVSCKDEREAMRSMLWFNVAHYVLRSWPWIITALASLILIPDSLLSVGGAGNGVVDHERAYPRLISMLLPVGLRGVLVASFFAAFMSTVDSQLNWGASYLVNDFYKRFIKKEGTGAHYVFVSRVMTLVLTLLAAGVAFFTESIGAVFTFVLNLTAGVGPVYLLRWFWRRINAWSEIAAMTASLPLILIRSHFFAVLGIPADPSLQLLYMVLGTALFWMPVTFLTRPVPEKVLGNFFARVGPPGFWGKMGSLKGRDVFWRSSFKSWLVSLAALFATLVGPIEILFGRWALGLFISAFALAGWFYVWRGELTVKI